MSNLSHNTKIKLVSKESLLCLSTILTMIQIVFAIFRHLIYGYNRIFEICRLITLFSLLFVALFFIYDNYKKFGLSRVKNIFKTYFSNCQLLLLALFVLLLLSCIINSAAYYDISFLNNYEALLDVFISFFVGFPLGRYFYHHELNLSIKKCIYYIIFILTAIMIAILIIVFLHIELQCGNFEGIGMDLYKGRLCINCNPNTVGVYSGIIFLICLYIGLKHNGIKRILFFVISLVHFSILVFSNSRGALIATLLSVFFIAGLGTFYSKFLLKSKIVYNRNVTLQNIRNNYTESIFQKIVISACIGFLSVIFLYIFRYILLFIYGLNNSSGQTIVRDLDITNTSGRLEVWNASLKLIFLNLKNILIGESPANIIIALDKVMNSNLGYYTHNQFLEIAVAQGVISVFVYSAYLIIIAYKCMIIVFDKNNRIKWLKKIIPFFILYLVVFNLTEAGLLYYGWMIGIVFFVLCGWCSEVIKGK